MDTGSWQCMAWEAHGYWLVACLRKKFFVERYAKEKYGEPFEAYGAFAFAGMNLVLDVIEKVGPDRKKVRDELRKTKNYDSIIGKVTLDDHGQNTVDLITKYVIQDGKWILWEDSEYAGGKRKLAKK